VLSAAGERGRFAVQEKALRGIELVGRIVARFFLVGQHDDGLGAEQAGAEQAGVDRIVGRIGVDAPRDLRKLRRLVGRGGVDPAPLGIDRRA
jgi:hypothetical protein